MEWPNCSKLSGSDFNRCLCELPEFVSITTECLTRAVLDDSDPYDAFNEGYSRMCQREPEIYELSREVDYSDLKNGISTANSTMKNVALSQAFGAALISYWFLVCVCRIAYVALASFAPGKLRTLRNLSAVKKIKSKLIYPPIFKSDGSKISASFRKLRLGSQLRWTSAVIGLFVMLDLIFLFVSLPVINQSILFKTESMQFKKLLGYRSGCLTVFLLPLLIVFGGRNNILMPWTRWSLGVFTLFHKWIARTVFFNVVVHAISYSLLRTEQGLYPGVFRKPYWRWAAVAIGSLSLILFSSFKIFRRKNYEVFLVLHISFAVTFLIGAWYHLRTLDYGKSQLIATMALWGFDRMFRLVRMILLSPGEATISHNKGLTCLLIGNPGQWMDPPGSYVFVHFSGYRFWQSHPFSIVPTLDGGMKLCISRKKGLTEGLAKIKEGRVKVWIDGPYGHHVSYKGHSDVVFVAGGVGITLALGLIYGLVNSKEPYHIYLYWAIPTSDYQHFFESDIAKLLPDVTIEIFVTKEKDLDGEKVETGYWHVGHMDIPSILSKHGDQGTSSAFTVCGPPKMNNEVRQETCRLLDKGVSVTFTEDLFNY